MCGSRKVQVVLPAFFVDGGPASGLLYIEPDEGAEIRAWYCPDCDDSDSGMPDEADDITTQETSR